MPDGSRNSPLSVMMAIDVFKKKKSIGYVRNINEISKAFSILSESIKNGDFSASIIGRHIYKSITNPAIRKRKVSAINLEEFLVDFFGGKIIDKKVRKGITVRIQSFGDEEINRRVSRNKLEKCDLKLGEQIFSAKTLIPKNKELNIGSFSSEALFKGFLPRIPNERRHLGSKPLLKKIFSKIKKRRKWKKFVNRFVKMIDNIFVYDWIISIKNDKIFAVYTIRSKKLKKILISHIKAGPKEALKVLNRFEAHALRIEIKPILKEAKHVEVNLFGKSTKKLEKIENIFEQIEVIVLRALCIGNINENLRKNVFGKINKMFKLLGLK